MFRFVMIVMWFAFVPLSFAEVELNKYSNSFQSLNFNEFMYQKSDFWQKYKHMFRMKRTLYKGAVGQFEVGVRKRPAMYASWKW